MPGIKPLRKIQLSREAHGTQGTATTDYIIWRGGGTLQDNRETVFVEEDVGILPGVDRTYVPVKGGELVFTDTPATFEQLPYIFDSAIYLATATTDASSAFIRTYTMPLQSSDNKSSTDLQTVSFKAGDNQEVEDMSFSFISNFTLKGAAGEALMVGATWKGREVTTDAAGFDTTVTLQSVEEILFSKGKIYIDAVGGTIGTTQVTKTLLGADLAWDTGWKSENTADGRLDFSFIKQVGPEVVLDVRFEHNGTAQAEKAAWRAETSRLLQLKFEGSALTTTDAAATYDVNTLIVNLPGKWESFSALDEQDGDDIVTGTFRSRYNATSGTGPEIILANETETL